MIYRVQVIREVQQSVVVEVDVPNQLNPGSRGSDDWVKRSAEDLASELNDNDWRDEDSVIDENQTSILSREVTDKWDAA